VDHPQRDIRFTSTEDGVDIAFWEIGEGKPVVILNNWGLSHAELEWTVPSIASFYTDMAERYRLIRFDPRGIGLSGDPPGGWGAESASGVQAGMSTREMGLDIEAVSKALELDSFVLMAIAVQGPVGIMYAAEHPDMVTELILCQAMADMADSAFTPWIRVEIEITRLKKETGDAGRLAAYRSPWEALAPDEDPAIMIRLAEASDHRIDTTLAHPQFEWNARSLLENVAIPTLVLCPRNPPLGGAEGLLSDSRELASGISDSQLRVVDGVLVPYFADQAAVLEAIDGFLKPERPTVELSGFRTVVFTDIVESTEYVRRVGDDAGRAAVRELEQQIATLASGHDGRVVKNLGDGSLVSFGSNSSAITFALEVQDKCSDGPLQLRVGMAAGEPIQEDGDIHGTVVAQASRIGDLGDAGEVIVSDSVRQLAAGKGFTFEPRGEVLLKGFDEPERVWTVTQKRRP